MKEYNKAHLIKFRKSLRNNMTSAEAGLWYLLRSRQILGVKFRRQFSVNNYILDFFCPETKLAIELDGHGHYTEEGRKSDIERDTKLGKLGIQVLRIENKLVFENTSQVIDAIETALKERLGNGAS